MPVDNSEIVSAAPKSLLAGMTAFISSWFGIEHYMAEEPAFHNLFVGAKGEKLIPSESAMVGDLCTVIHRLKANGG